MTLITHIWSDNLNVISGEGRIINSETKEVVNEDRKKIFSSKNYFIAFHGRCDFDEKSLPNIIDTFVKQSVSEHPEEIAHDLLKLLKSINPNLPSGIFIGGHYNNIVYSIYFIVNSDEAIKVDTHDKKSGLRFNGIDANHAKQIIEIYKSCFKENFGRDYTENETYREISNDQLNSFLTQFHKCVHDSANKEMGIGLKADIGIIRDAKFEWLINNHHRLFS